MNALKILFYFYSSTNAVWPLISKTQNTNEKLECAQAPFHFPRQDIITAFHSFLIWKLQKGECFFYIKLSDLINSRHVSSHPQQSENADRSTLHIAYVFIIIILIIIKYKIIIIIISATSTLSHHHSHWVSSVFFQLSKVRLVFNTCFICSCLDAMKIKSGICYLDL